VKYYAGIGNRKTPADILFRMKVYARQLEAFGFTLRSGGADGADSAFEDAVSPEHRDIYLPWAGYNHKTGIVSGYDTALAEIAEKYYSAYSVWSTDVPTWRELSGGVKQLHTRNVAQILGHASPPVLSLFVLCWTPRARAGGGTGQAIRVAKGYGVPVYDLADPNNTFELDWLHTAL
jgi:hypothetical protein